VYHDSSRIPYKYFRIGHITGERETTVSDATLLQDVAKSLLRDMTKEASPKGADGVIAIVIVDNPELGFVTDVGVTALKHNFTARGTLVRFERDEGGNPIRR
jgi:uncharacterized protein YbjQ (UPF0145 family)